MRANVAKQIMLRGEPVLGCSVESGSPLVTEFLGNCGFDFLLFDARHSPMGCGSTLQTLASVSSGLAVPMARVICTNRELIASLLNVGVLGIVAPAIDTVEDAEFAASACLFPPQGARCWGMESTAHLVPEYHERANEQIFVAVQFDNASAIKNAEAILATPGIDACYVEPAGLALSMGFSPRDASGREEFARTVERIVAACRETGKTAGIFAASPDEILMRVEQGFRMVTAGSDLLFLARGAAAMKPMLESIGRGARGIEHLPPY